MPQRNDGKHHRSSRGTVIQSVPPRTAVRKELARGASGTHVRNAELRKQMEKMKKHRKQKTRKRRESEESYDAEISNGTPTKRQNTGKNSPESKAGDETPGTTERMGGDSDNESSATEVEALGLDPQGKGDDMEEEEGDGQQMGTYGRLILEEMKKMNGRIDKLEEGMNYTNEGEKEHRKRKLTDPQKALVRNYVRNKVFPKLKFITDRTLKKQNWIIEEAMEELKVKEERKKEYEDNLIRTIRMEMAQKRNGLTQKIKTIIKGKYTGLLHKNCNTMEYKLLTKINFVLGIKIIIKGKVYSLGSRNATTLHTIYTN